jgi:hypothetical protein
LALQYSTRKAKTIGGLMREQWEDKIVSEIDSALNKWLDVIPPHRLSFFYLPFSRLPMIPLDSALEQTTTERGILHAVGHSTRGLLPHANPRPSTVHSIS